MAATVHIFPGLLNDLTEVSRLANDGRRCQCLERSPDLLENSAGLGRQMTTVFVLLYGSEHLASGLVEVETEQRATDCTRRAEAKFSTRPALSVVGRGVSTKALRHSL